MTDEELRKNLGIHMAARLHTEDAKCSANKWADEDEDDEWVPDTISWADGTKTSIPHVDENALPGAPAVALSPDIAAEVPVTSVARNSGPRKGKSPTQSNTSSPLVKPGVLAHGKGLILKGGHEKPTLVAKPPPPPTPAKSPWAPLPPIERASILPMEPPEQRHNRERQAPREIAADDFSRPPWRDGQTSGPRELFNSQSGRYEPAGERRSLQRLGSHPGRYAPAVLQRPATTTRETERPAEPSAAFQTSRTSSQDGPYNRRRGSSNVSGGSGFVQRMSKDHMPMPNIDAFGGRRGSFTGGSDTVESPRTFSSPRMHSGQPWQMRSSPRMVPAAPHQQQSITDAKPLQASGPADLVKGPAPKPGESEIEYQRRIMRERRELAMRRRLEEEAKEEAARKERIRIKLEAMGPAPERHSVKKEREAAAAKEVAAKEEPAPGDEDAAETEATTDQATVPALPKESIVPAEEAAEQITPTTNTAHIQIQKKQHPKKMRGDESQSTPASAFATTARPRTGTSPDSTSVPRAATPLGAPAGASYRGAGEAEKAADGSMAPYNSSSRLVSQEDKRQPWANPPAAAGWGHSSSSCIWGSPNNDRSLGNGTFTSDLGGVSESRPGGAPVKSGPGPIAPPISARSQMPPSKPDSSASRLPPPIAPPSKQPQNQSHVADGSCRTGLDAWRTPNIIEEQDRAIELENKRRWEERLRDFSSHGLTLEQAQAPIQDTWRPVELRSDGSRGETLKPETVVLKSRSEKKNGGTWEAPLGGTRNTNVSEHVGQSMAPAAPTTRGSRFFPAREARQEEAFVPPADTDASRTKSPSPPPPTMIGHPAYDGDAKHPHVHFPPRKPVVKLPPASASAPKSAATPTASYASVISGIRTGHRQPLKCPENVPHENWQDKINNLFGKKTTTTPAKSTVVDSASKHALDHLAPQGSATVSLPAAPAIEAILSVDETSCTTKAMDEDCFEEQEMGSLPTVCMPRETPDIALLPLPAVHFRTPRSYRLFVPTSRERYLFEVEPVRRVWFPGMIEPRQISIDVRRGFQFSTSRPSRGRGGQRGGSGVSRRGGPSKVRESSGTYAEPQGRTGSRRGNRNPRYNSRASDGWSRHAPISQAT